MSLSQRVWLNDESHRNNLDCLEIATHHIKHGDCQRAASFIREFIGRERPRRKERRRLREQHGIRQICSRYESREESLKNELREAIALRLLPQNTPERQEALV